MTYTLAKELKDAGFPQNNRTYYCTDLSEFTYSRNCAPYEKQKCGNHEQLSAPTLAELIEACGDKFMALLKLDDGSGWGALKSGDILGRNIEAPTPEEAVGRLWLALNKK